MHALGNGGHPMVFVIVGALAFLGIFLAVLDRRMAPPQTSRPQMPSTTGAGAIHASSALWPRRGRVLGGTAKLTYRLLDGFSFDAEVPVDRLHVAVADVVRTMVNRRREHAVGRLSSSAPSTGAVVIWQRHDGQGWALHIQGPGPVWSVCVPQVWAPRGRITDVAELEHFLTSLLRKLHTLDPSTHIEP